jgi:hypothetical protein
VKRYGWLIALGVGALAAFAVATLPAGLAGSQLGRYGIGASAYEGSIWSGRATGLQLGGSLLGDLQWHLNARALLGGRLAGHARLDGLGGSLDTDFDAGLSGNSQLGATVFSFPVDTLGQLPFGVPKGWRGRIRGTFADIEITNGWPAKVHGTLDMDDLIAPPPRNANVGSFHIVLPHPQPTGAASLPGHLTALVTDQDGPFAVQAQLSIATDRSFLLEGTVKPRGAVPEGMQYSLDLLGPPDATGARPFSVSGTL